MSRIFVSGANGFVGRHVCRDLVEAGHVVTAGVRRPGAAPDGTREFIVGDLGSLTDWTDGLANQDYVIHLAARVHVMSESSSDPLAAFTEANTAGTIRLAQQAILAGVQRFVFVSSIKAQGESRSLAYSAADDTHPTDDYGVSKRLAENGLRDLEAGFPLGVVVLRPPLIYGDGVGGNLLRLMNIIDRGVPLPLSSVKNERAMISVHNFVRILEHAIDPHCGAGQAILVSDSETLSTAQVVRELAAGLGRSPRLLPFPPRMMVLAGRLFGRMDEIDRLIGDLKIVSNVSQLAPRYAEKINARDALRDTARAFATAKQRAR